MWLFPEEVPDALSSKDPAKVSEALEVLTRYLDDMNVFPLAPPHVDAAIYGGRLPEGVALNLMRIWESWPDFDPPLGEADRYVALLDVLRDTDTTTVAYRAALDCRVTKDLAAIRPMLAALSQRPAAEWPRLATFVDHLLDGDPVFRAAVVDGLVQHRGSEAVAALAADAAVGFTAEARARMMAA